MNFERLAISVYDFLGYLLPGYVVLIACSLIESTFFGTWFLSLAFLTTHAVAFATIAYFMGHVAHAIASAMTTSKRWKPIIQARTERLADPTRAVVRAELDRTYGTDIQAKTLNNLDTYSLADAYIVATGGSSERDMLIAREGFFKQSVTAFAVMSAVSMSSLFKGGLIIQTQPGRVYSLGAAMSIAAVFSAVVVTILFRSRFGFFHRVKINNTLRHFLAIRAKEHRDR